MARRGLAPLADAAAGIGDPQVRNWGTLGGSVAHADPSAELPLCLLALKGSVVLRRHQGQRVLPAEQFFTGMLSTARAGDELLQAVRFPLARPGQGFGFREFSRRHGDFAVCAVAAVADAQSLRVAVGGVADVCVLSTEGYWPVTDASLRSQGKSTPFSGYELPGRVLATLVGGQVAYQA